MEPLSLPTLKRFTLLARKYFTHSSPGARKTEEHEAVEALESHDYLKLVQDGKPRSEEMIPVADPGSNADSQETTSHKDPVASLAEVLRRSSLGRRVSNNQQSFCCGCKEPIPKGKP